MTLFQLCYNKQHYIAFVKVRNAGIFVKISKLTYVETLTIYLITLTEMLVYL